MVIKDGPTLNLRDEKGRVRIQIAKSNVNSMAGISLYNENSMSIAQLNLTRSGFPALTLFGQDAKPRVMMGVIEDGSALLALLDKNGKVIWSAIK
jgi:hypothetical protein